MLLFNKYAQPRSSVSEIVQSQEKTSPVADLATDRGRIAELLLMHRALIRRRIIGRLRRFPQFGIDPDDVLSSVIRVVDFGALRGILRPSGDEEFWAYVAAVTDNKVISRLRTARVRHAPIPPGRVEPRWLDRPFSACTDDDQAAALLHRALMLAPSDSDRELIMWRLNGAPYSAIAAATGRSEEALRTQWTKLCRHLRQEMRRSTDEALPPPPPPSH